MEAIWLENSENHRVVILFHAYTGTPADVRILANFLHRHHYNVYIPVFKGHEQSDVQAILSATPYEWWQEAQQAVRLVRSKGYSTIAALGLSMGGIMATGLAVAQQVEIAGTFCSPVSVQNAQLPGLLTAFMEFAEASLKKQGILLEQVPDLRQQAIEQMAAIQELAASFASQLSIVTGPFYIAQAEQDTLVNPEVSIEMKEKLVNAAVDFHWFEESGHVITVGKQKQEFQETVLQFLEEQEWR